MASVQESTLEKPAVRIRRYRLVTVEPVVFLMLAIQGGFVALRTLYIEHRLAVSYNYTLPTGDVNGTCGAANATKDPTQEQIESKTALWVAYMKGVSVALPLFGALLFGAASDFIGRKPILTVSASGHLLAAALFLCVAYFNLPLFCLVVGEIILGICGDSVVPESAAYAYVTDVYQGNERSFRIFLVDVLIYLGFGASQIVVTTILQLTASNFSIAYLTIFVTAIVNFLYVTIPRVVVESVDKRPFSRGVFRDLFAQIYWLFKNNTNGRRPRIILLLANMILYELVYEAVYSVITIYGLGPPFCWSETFVGVYNVIVNIAPAVASILALKLLGLCMSEYWMVYLGFLSGIALMITTSLAKTTALIAYVAPSVGLLRVLPTPILKFLATQLVKVDEQGSLFGAVAVLSSVGRALSPVVMNGIYSYTVKIGHPTVTFYVAGGILVIPLFINGYLHARQRWPSSSYQQVTTISDENGHDRVTVP
ncbi:proton-coupled folate transporter-like [Acanthaster planci]|uniref:Proton-coupled folate transporter n=1 Tax=Acanthaster planci TaxID=133434 RepID=A0A8B7Z1L5_ACAPL|nr:proton-coupled folate transporter-like [Acanthaster planci]XP_022099494.1 proton-coupled folate transporter-like [Acanthaster planci]XP_022099495.1 proton-coupled folate transporter-like [Acanthaster planci]